MKTRRLGRSDLMVSEIGLGTWEPSRPDGLTEATLIVRAALDLGITLFDTATSYAGAHDLLAWGLRGVDRDRYVISDKVYFRPDGGGSLTRPHIVDSVDAALTTMRVGHIDVVSAHRFDPGTPLEETIAAFGDLVRMGKIRHYGCSEWTAGQIERAVEYADQLGVARPVCNQPQYSVIWRVPEAEVLPACERLGLGSVVFWALAQGVLTDKYRPDTPPEPGTRGGTESGRLTMDHVMRRPLLERVALFARLAAKRRLTAAQLALAWTLRHPSVTSTLVGASSVGQLTENASASGVTLDEETLRLVDAVFAGCVQADPAATG